MFAGLMSRWMIPFAWAASQGVGDVDSQVENLIDLWRMLANHVFQRDAIEKFHGDKRFAVCLSNVVDGSDVRMIED